MSFLISSFRSFLSRQAETVSAVRDTEAKGAIEAETWVTENVRDVGLLLNDAFDLFRKVRASAWGAVLFLLFRK